MPFSYFFSRFRKTIRALLFATFSPIKMPVLQVSKAPLTLSKSTVLFVLKRKIRLKCTSHKAEYLNLVKITIEPRDRIHFFFCSEYVFDLSMHGISPELKVTPGQIKWFLWWSSTQFLCGNIIE